MKKLFPSLLLLLTSYSLLSQSWDLGINAKIYDPQGEFNTNVEGIAGGIGIRGLRNNASGRWSVGGELGIAMYSSDTYDLQTDNGTFEIYEEDCFWTAHGVVQYTIYRTDLIRTYAEGRIGATTFFSSRLAENEDAPFEDEFKFHGTAFNSGLGAGVTINFGQLFGKERNILNLDLGAKLHSGSTSSYREMDNIDRASSLEEGQYRSLTHYMGYHFGLLINL